MTRAERASLERLWPLLVFLVAPLVVFPWRFVSRGMVDGGDDLMSNLPMLTYSARKLLSLDILWTPDCWLGAPLLSEPEYATFYLPRIVLLFGRPLVAFTLYQLGHYVLAQSGMYLYLRTLRARRGAAVVGALVYAFCGFMTAHRGHTMYLAAGAWAPVFLYFLQRSVRTPDRRTILAACVSFAMLPFAGAVQLTAYLATMTLVLFGVTSLSEKRLRPVAIAALTLAPALLISAIQVLPSVELSTTLAMERRFDYQFNTAMSLHPAMVSALALPNAVGTEFYVRLGTVALALAVAGAVARRRNAIARGWIAVALCGLVLAFGRYVPVLPRLLHALPLVRNFRGPVRHVFEASLAAGVLSGLGVDAMLRHGRFPKRSHALWLVGGVAALITSVWVGLQLAKRQSLPAIAATYLPRIDLETALTAFALLALWLAVSGLPWRGGRNSRVALIALLVVGEASSALHAHLYADDLPDWHQLLGAAIRPTAVRGVTRLLPASENLGPRSLAWNTALLFPGVQSVTPYVSAAPHDFAELLDLDMHGFARDSATLRSSPLPSLFGITHLVMPRQLCGAPSVQLGHPEGGCTVSYPGDVERALPGPCAIEPVTPPVRWALDVRAHTEHGPGVLDVRFDGGRPDARGPLTSVARSIPVHEGSSGDRSVVEVSLGAFGELAQVSLTNFGDTAIRVRGAYLVGFGDPLATLTPRVPVVGTRLSHDEYAIRLSPDGQLGTADVPVHWPHGTTDTVPMLLEVVARAAEPIDQDLVVDLFAEGGYDPEAAQIVVHASELSPRDYRRFSRIVWAPAPPDPSRVRLRVFVLGHGTAEIQSARLSGILITSHLVDDAPFWNRLRGRFDGTELLLPADGGAFVSRRALSLQLVRLRARTEPGRTLSPHGASLSMQDLDGAPRRWPLPLETVARDGSYVRTVALSAPAGAAVFAVTPESERGAVALELSDACVAAPYEPEARLGSGLWLYRNEHALPRAFTVPVTRGVASVQDASSPLSTDPVFARGDAATVEDARGVRTRGRGRILDSDFGSTRVSVRVDGSALGTFLVVNDHFDPAWHATLDDQPAPLLRANGLVRGMDIPPGIHRIVMRYATPWSVWLGLALSLTGFALALAAPWLLIRLERRRTGAP